jgi:hypothetical protein
MMLEESHSEMGRWLSQPWWVGLGVLLATAVALAGVLLTSGGSPSYSIRGNCVAQGSNNKVTCSSVGSEMRP